MTKGEREILERCVARLTNDFYLVAFPVQDYFAFSNLERDGVNIRFYFYLGFVFFYEPIGCFCFFKAKGLNDGISYLFWANLFTYEI
jgi:hypothetical protein